MITSQLCKINNSTSSCGVLVRNGAVDLKKRLASSLVSWKEHRDLCVRDPYYFGKTVGRTVGVCGWRSDAPLALTTASARCHHSMQRWNLGDLGDESVQPRASGAQLAARMIQPHFCVIRRVRKNGYQPWRQNDISFLWHETVCRQWSLKMLRFPVEKNVNSTAKPLE